MELANPASFFVVWKGELCNIGGVCVFNIVVWLPNQICIPVFRVEGQTNTIFSFEFSTPYLCVSSSEKVVRVEPVFNHFRTEINFLWNDSTIIQNSINNTNWCISVHELCFFELLVVIFVALSCYREICLAVWPDGIQPWFESVHIFCFESRKNYSGFQAPSLALFHVSWNLWFLFIRGIGLKFVERVDWSYVAKCFHTCIMSPSSLRCRSVDRSSS